MLEYQEKCYQWFKRLQDKLINSFELIEQYYACSQKVKVAKFVRSKWDRIEGGGGEISIMRGNVFAKVGVNISKVYGSTPTALCDIIPRVDGSSNFFATGISVVAHMKSPLVPAVHFNTRYLQTENYWFGGGSDLTPLYPDDFETKKFHQAFKSVCDKYNPLYYTKFKAACDSYFYLPHRKEFRGVGGIFYDYLNSNDFDNDFNFTKNVGEAFLAIYPDIVKSKMFLPWSNSQYDDLLVKRGRYVEFNLLHDRGTKFGLMTNGNIEAILMSLPPEVKWP
ncbi:coproporphyrinogen III oxidase family protein [Orientia chuto str. Dubai]|uniref:coproporphyrinogen oxidase n=1 Tax=Orientia chuto str. Dubai TaxID=1359168 RepID=A0A0F3MMY1_9RICK|nr:oxygen-dependent coproporphyrinogen oxidase [Candidatus Orientia mediorientalis]KJV57075.1 coproporphyrinogen III oxidase family protein [Orientia chuto str. Dubai]